MCPTDDLVGRAMAAFRPLRRRGNLGTVADMETFLQGMVKPAGGLPAKTAR